MRHIAIALLLTLLLPLAARADEVPAAVSLFDEGNRLYDAKQYEAACKKYEASLKLDASSVDTRGRLALCYEKVDRLASAWSAWREVRAEARRSARKKAGDIAASHISALERRLAHLTIDAGGGAAPAGLDVTLDGTSIPADSFGTPVAVDKGAHELRASAPGRKPWSLVVTVQDGEQKAVKIGPLAAEEAPTVPPVAKVPSVPARPAAVSAPPSQQPSPAPVPPRGAEAPRPSSTRRWLGMSAVAAGVVMVGVGTWAGLDARAKRDDARAAGCSDDLSLCHPGDAYDTAQQSYSRANLSTGMFIAGAAFLAGGAILWWTAPNAAPAAGEEHTSWRVVPQVGSSRAGLVVAGTF